MPAQDIAYVELYTVDHPLVVREGPSTLAFLEAHADGIADIAFSCDDVAGTHEAALSAGDSPLASGPGMVVVSGFVERDGLVE